MNATRQPVLGDLDAHLLGEGTHLRLYDVLGAHVRTCNGVTGTAFALWAPNARRVSIVGDFNNWDGNRDRMWLRRDCGVWELFVPGVGPGTRYKYELEDNAGRLLPLRVDPVAFYAEQRPRNASIVWDAPRYPWSDRAWMDGRGSSLACSPAASTTCRRSSNP